MGTEELFKTLSDAWRTAAKCLSLRIEAPYVLKGEDGIDVFCVAYLPDFGSSNGMVIGFFSRPDHKLDTSLKLAAESRGLSYSFINYKVYEHYSENTFKEALADWGFFGDETLRPSWMADRKK